ncbi:hypothetical protein [Streptomyces sp. NPDC006285]|uniref:hypothetical protein n=1 Tax=Streptomyces sp. NPDC006285 TaxID=3364742 RepID=UPI003695DE9E
MASEPTAARAHLEQTVTSLPKNPAEWSREQRSQYTDAADTVTREEAGVASPAELPSGKKAGLFRRDR